jgi:hypothetical protein
MRSADIEDVDTLQVGQLDELDAIRCLHLAGGARWLAAGMRFEPVRLPILVERFCPRLERDFGGVRERRGDDARGQPDALFTRRSTLQQHAPGHRPGRRSGGPSPAPPSGIRRRRTAAAVRDTNLHVGRRRPRRRLLRGERSHDDTGKEDDRAGSEKEITHRTAPLRDGTRGYFRRVCSEW